jgi:hypothetical protein
MAPYLLEQLFLDHRTVCQTQIVKKETFQCSHAYGSSEQVTSAQAITNLYQLSTLDKRQNNQRFIFTQKT